MFKITKIKKTNFQKLIELITAINLGILTLGLQICYIRLSLEIFYGNELLIGLVLAIWLAGSSFGASLLANILRNTKIWRNLHFWVIPLLILFYFYFKISPKLFHLVPGLFYSTIEVIPILLTSTLPVSMISGVLFPFIIENIYKSQIESIAKKIVSVYMLESIGAIICAVTLNFIIFHFFNDLQVVSFCIVIFIIPFIFKPQKKIYIFLTIIYFILSFFLLLGGNQIQLHLNNFLYRPNKILFEGNSPYGNVKLFQLEELSIFVKQGGIVFSDPDLFTEEFRILLPLLSHPFAEDILILGGNLKGYLPQIKNIPSIKNIYYVEQDPTFIKFQKNAVAASTLETNIPNIKYIKNDIRNFLLKCGKKFDVIILNESEPYTLSLNRLYTTNFYILINNCLKENGLFFFSIKSSENFLNENLCKYINLLYNSLKREFHNVFIVPGDENYFLSSNKIKFDQLSILIEKKIKLYNLQPVYLTPVYLKYRLSKERLDNFHKQIEQSKVSETNNDFGLQGYLYHFKVLGQMRGAFIVKIMDVCKKNIYFLGFTFLFSLFLIKILLKKKQDKIFKFNLFMLGAIAISFEIIISLEYQIIWGTIYTGIALIFGLFMLGLAIGSYLIKQFYKKIKIILTNRIIYISFFIIGCSLLFPVAIPYSHFYTSILKWFFLKGIIFITIFTTGLVSGAYFSKLTLGLYETNKHYSSGLTYAIDIAGAIIASFFVTILFVPLLGLSKTIFIYLILILILMF